MFEEQFSERLATLRLAKGVSAREMSLSLGQNPSYINNIESGKAFPSMSVFFYICEYLEITPKDFFDFSSANPSQTNVIINNLKKVNPNYLASLDEIISALAHIN